MSNFDQGSQAISTLPNLIQQPDPTVTLKEVSNDDTVREDQRPRYAKFLAEIQQELIDMGVDPEVAAQRAPEMLGKRRASRNNGKKRETISRVGDPARVEFYAKWSDHQVLAESLKVIRCDAGSQSAVSRLVSIIETAEDPQSAAEVIAKREQQHIAQIRWSVTCAVNELRRRQAVRDGEDPTKVK